MGGSFTVGSGVAHASLDPHASELDSPAKLVDLVFCTEGFSLDAGWEAGAGAERLKAELRSDGTGAAEGFFGAGEGMDGSEISKRSFETLVVAGLGGAEGGLDAKLKSPKSFASNGERLAWAFCGGFEAIAGLGTGLGPASKKPPPLKGDVTLGAAIDDRWLLEEVTLANGSDLVCC